MDCSESNLNLESIHTTLQTHTYSKQRYAIYIRLFTYFSFNEHMFSIWIYFASLFEVESCVEAKRMQSLAGSFLKKMKIKPTEKNTHTSLHKNQSISLHT